jgi:hypothetical protein
VAQPLTIRAAPDQSLYERGRRMVANSALGHALEEGLPKIARFLDLVPTETVNSPTYAEHRQQALAPDYLLPSPHGASANITHAVLHAAGQLTNIPTAAAAAATGPVIGGAMRLAPVATKVALAIPGIYGAVKSGFDAKDRFASGDDTGGTEDVVNAILDAGLAGHSLKSAADELPFIRDLIDRIPPVRIPGIPVRKLIMNRADETLPLDTMTHRQVYEMGKANGVNLAMSLASGDSLVPRALKYAGEYSLLGGTDFEANKARNIAGMDAMAKDLADKTGAAAMDRETFGNQAVQGLKDRQKQLQGQAGTIYEDLKGRYGASVPDSTGIQQTAQHIVDENADYYTKHPEILSGGTGKAWKIVQSLAAGDPAGPDADNFKQLLNLRTDLMDIYRGPETIGTRPVGWLKGMVGVIDDAVTSTLSSPDEASFRNAGDLYTQAKEMDNPQTTLGQLMRSQDGTTAANTLHNMYPQQTREFQDSMVQLGRPELNNQLRRQTIERYVSPSGNGTELKTLPGRFGKQQVEQVAAHLQPDDIEGLKNLGRLSKPVYEGSGGSPSAARGIPVAELGIAAGGVGGVATGLIMGSPAAVIGGAMTATTPALRKAAAKIITSPSLTDMMMGPHPVGPLPVTPPLLLPGGPGAKSPLGNWAASTAGSVLGTPLPQPQTMAGQATIKDFKDLPKILGPALLKAEPKPPARAPTPPPVESDADMARRLGFKLDTPPVAVAGPKAASAPAESDEDLAKRLGFTLDPAK